MREEPDQFLRGAGPGECQELARGAEGQTGADGSLFGVAMREEEAAREMNEQFVEFGGGGR